MSQHQPIAAAEATALPTKAAAPSDAPTACPEPACPKLVEGVVPDWVAAYLASLRTNFQKAEAARAAGVDIATVVELRETHPDFAAKERRIMMAFADILEAEAIRRATTLPTPGPDGKVHRPIGSDRLLLRLMEHYIPGFAPQKKAARPEQAQRACPEPARPDAATEKLKEQIERLTRDLNHSRYLHGELSKQYRDLDSRYISLLRTHPAPHIIHQKQANHPEVPEPARPEQAQRVERASASRKGPEPACPEPVERVERAERVERSSHSHSNKSGSETSTTPKTTPASTIGPITPAPESLSPSIPETTPEGPELVEGEAFIAREQAKLKAALAELNAQYKLLPNEGCYPPDIRTLKNRARYRHLLDVSTRIDNGLSFEQALAQTTPAIRPP